jgi:hypothetical protein
MIGFFAVDRSPSQMLQASCFIIKDGRVSSDKSMIRIMFLPRQKAYIKIKSYSKPYLCTCILHKTCMIQITCRLGIWLCDEDMRIFHLYNPSLCKVIKNEG